MLKRIPNGARPLENGPEPFLAKCQECSKTFWKYAVKYNTKFQIYTYQDESGLRWHGNKCNKCGTEKMRDRSYKSGRNKPIADHTSGTHKKGYDAELVAKKYFENMGFVVSQTRQSGPDLILNLGGHLELTCEVKLACPQYKEYPSRLRIGWIKPKRMNDDLICIVHPDGRLHVDEMSHWLKNSGKYGVKSVTSLFN